MRQLEHALDLLAERAEPLPTDVLVERLEAQLAAEGAATTAPEVAGADATGPRPRRPKLGRVWWRGPLVAVGVAVAIFVVVAGSMLLLGGDQSGVVEEPIPTVTTTVPTSLPDMAPLVTIDADQVNYPLSEDATSGVAVDDGSLWASTEAGIIRWNLEERDAVLFTSADDLPFTDQVLGGIAIAPEGTVWAFSWPQDLARFDGTRWAEPDGYDQLDIVNPRCSLDEGCRNSITAMAVGPDNLLSLAVGPETLIQYDGARWDVLPVSDVETHADGASAWATDIAVALDGTLWIASWEELLRYDGTTWDRFATLDGLPSGMVNSVAVAPNGDVWVSTFDGFEGDAAGGVARFDGNTWEVFDEADGLYENSTSALAVGPDGTVWAVHSEFDPMATNTESTNGGISRFDGTTWSATTIADLGGGFGGGAVVDDTGVLWVTSRRGVVGFDGTEATVLRLPDGTRPPINALPFALPSQILASSESPIEWRWWDPLSDGSSDAMNTQALVKGSECYGSGGDQRPSEVVEFGTNRIDFTLGHRVTPDIVITDEVGTVTNVGNPFGELAWLCSVAITDTHILAVGSGVSWSEDGFTWQGIEAFEEIAGSNVDGANLMWAAAGPGGYLVFGREGAVWFSEDLQTWYETPLEGNELTGTSVWGMVGPTGVAVGEEIVIAMFEDGWVGTRRDG